MMLNLWERDDVNVVGVVSTKRILNLLLWQPVHFLPPPTPCHNIRLFICRMAQHYVVNVVFKLRPFPLQSCTLRGVPGKLLAQFHKVCTSHRLDSEMTSYKPASTRRDGKGIRKS